MQRDGCLAQAHVEQQASAAVPGETADGAKLASEDGIWGPLSWGALGLGGLALIGGIGAGVTWLGVLERLQQSCDQGTCVLGDDVEAADEQLYVGLGWAAPILIGAGSVAASLGIAGLLLLPAQESAEASVSTEVVAPSLVVAQR